MFKVITDKEKMPSLDTIIQEIIKKSEGKIGMILTHTGVVRSFTRTGEKVKGVKVKVDREKLSEIIDTAQTLPGIFEVRVYIREGELEVGDILMLLVVAGDFRDNVVNALTHVLNLIKASVTSKEEMPINA
ncbi:molybdenum cofactor biosynthesis protein MoaE [Thermodesulfatator autotrophicus]|uniref:Molybdopterin synthase catalytic subunit n=1 Tax=Thermodesulfatator autotrophicus TaxID=1795632 RepID=A0A177E763_9BACT|nr:molybdenum cofactor biosynthesis protein MoaE [Thermodesulfatator autotrophicus]OAG27787.1 hypothetical protein TH606_04925 [Thermodesulfatator autotrophicus]